MTTSSLRFANPSVKPRQSTTLKFCRLIAYSKFHRISKFANHVTRNDVIMMSLLKQWENADLSETSHIMFHSKGLDESYPKMQVLSNLSDFVKSCGHLKGTSGRKKS